MLVDGAVTNVLSKVPAQAVEAEKAGYDAVWGSETSHDPFLPLLLAAEHTTRLEIGTGIAVAFARNPMNLANLGWDLNAYSGGRFLLGLGSQIKPHITKRFSMPWSHPAPRMRELISAMKAIWATWQDGTKLDFRGEFYTHTLMTPFFTPEPNEFGAPRVFLAAVGEGMTRVAGEVADGMLVHGFTTEKYFKEVTLPTIDAGLSASGRSRGDFQFAYSQFVVTGADEVETTRVDAAVRKQIAFYGSTPAYRPVLEAHGWGDLQTELNGLSKQGEWDTMAGLITDEVLEAFAVVAPPDGVAQGILARIGDVVDRVSLYMPKLPSEAVTSQIVGDLKAA